MRATSSCRATASYESTISFWRGRELCPVAFCLGRDCSQSRGTRLLDLVNARPYDDWGSRPLTASAVAAEATTTLRLGSYVFCNEYRHPVILAREAATLDMLSEGRFELGPGAGERILKLAAREADIITIGSKITAQGLDPSDATLEQKIAWIKEAAGKRF